MIRRPPLLGRGQLHFLLWQARADSAKARAELGVEPLAWREGIRAHRALDDRQRAASEPRYGGRALPQRDAGQRARDPLDLLLAHRGEERQRRASARRSSSATGNSPPANPNRSR